MTRSLFICNILIAGVPCSAERRNEAFTVGKTFCFTQMSKRRGKDENRRRRFDLMHRSPAFLIYYLLHSDSLSPAYFNPGANPTSEATAILDAPFSYHHQFPFPISPLLLFPQSETASSNDRSTPIFSLFLVHFNGRTLRLQSDHVLMCVCNVLGA